MNSKLLIVKHSEINEYQAFIDDIVSGEAYDVYSKDMSLKNRRLLFILTLDDLGYDAIASNLPRFTRWCSEGMNRDCRGVEELRQRRRCGFYRQLSRMEQ